uniref:Uncharacterized protein n=1 Tax=Ascaris lumbricoides TaxID=6252 RepID=A0A0M3ICK8_ASCLU
MDPSKCHAQKATLATHHPVGSRKQSITVQLTRSARRFSTVLAPQFTKLDPLPMLQKCRSLHIRISDITQFEVAVERYLANNAVQFSPIDFEITDENNKRIFNVSLHPEEMVLAEGARRIFTLTFGESSSDDNESVISKIRHPVSGMRLFEFVEHASTETIQIASCVDGDSRCLIEQFSSSWLRTLSLCGCLFTRIQWHFKKDDQIIAIVRPQFAFFDENSIRMEWSEQADDEVRLLVIAFAMTQIVREAFPSLTHILNEQRIRRHG